MTSAQREREELARLDHEITVLFDAQPQSLELLELLGWRKEALDIERIFRQERRRRYLEDKDWWETTIKRSSPDCAKREEEAN